MHMLGRDEKSSLAKIQQRWQRDEQGQSKAEAHAVIHPRNARALKSGFKLACRVRTESIRRMSNAPI
jgi:hypothetical protein